MFLNAENINFEYTTEKKVLNGVSLILQKNKTLSIVGASGCGKSTLLRIISGILPHTKSNKLSGRIRINGQTPDEYRKSGKLAFMFQESTLMPNLTVKENISFPLKIKGIKDDERVSNLLQTVGLEDYANYLPKQLSGGMKTRVALARSFITGPELLLLDEPFSALDIAWKSKLYIELEKLREQFMTTTIVVTHDVQEALLLSNKIMIMSHYGEIKKEYEVKLNTTLTERVEDIPEFLKEVYADYLVPIQKMIILDGNRKIITNSEVTKIYEELIRAAGNERLEKNFSLNLDHIRGFSNSAEVNKLLYDTYKKAITLEFKHRLIWDILAYDHITETIRSEIFSFYFKNIESLSKMSRNLYAYRETSHNPSIFFRTLKESIEGNSVNVTSKKWIYLCALYSVRELPETLDYLNSIISGEVENLDYNFAKEVAKKIKDKIENEKVDVIPIA